jgi:hypothetical protein
MSLEFVRRVGDEGALLIEGLFKPNHGTFKCLG